MPGRIQKRRTSRRVKVADGDLDFDFPVLPLPLPLSFPFLSFPLPLPSPLPFEGWGSLGFEPGFLVCGYGQFNREHEPVVKKVMHHPFSLANFLSANNCWAFALLGAPAT